MAKGFVKTATDTLNLRSADGKDILIFKNHQGYARLHAVVMERLLDAFIDDYLITDTQHLECLLYTYRHLMNGQDFLQRLVMKFRQAVDDTGRPPEIAHVQICHILHEWVRCAWCDFAENSELEDAVVHFVETIGKSKKIMLFAQQVLNEIQAQVHRYTRIRMN
jgi:hypothetical protein